MRDSDSCCGRSYACAGPLRVAQAMGLPACTTHTTHFQSEDMDIVTYAGADVEDGFARIEDNAVGRLAT